MVKNLITIGRDPIELLLVKQAFPQVDAHALLFYIQGRKMLFDFANVLVFSILGAAFVGVNLLIGRLLRPANPQERKLSSYECGEPATGSAWVNFNIRFYIVALIFIIFEVEIAFIFPVAATFRRWVENGQGAFAFLEIFVFMVILLVGLIYAWKKGDLDWVKKVNP